MSAGPAARIVSDETPERLSKAFDAEMPIAGPKTSRCGRRPSTGSLRVCSRRGVFGGNEGAAIALQCGIEALLETDRVGGV